MGTATPVKQITGAAPVKESPGNWKHPRLAEITRRQSKTIFSEKNVRQIAYNIGALVVVEVLRKKAVPRVPAQLLNKQLREYSVYVYTLIVLVFVFNIIRALLPLVRKPDDFSDIPLTPAQRKLLGLPPSSVKVSTPNSVYSTPPRYSRTPSLAGSPASIKSYTSSPLSNVGSPASGTRLSNSPYSPYSPTKPGTSPSKLGTSPSKKNEGYFSPSPAANPLLQKAMGGSARRQSFGSSSTFGTSTNFASSTASSIFGDGPATPTPATGKRSSVALNSKWLYEKGRRTSGSSWMGQ